MESPRNIGLDNEGHNCQFVLGSYILADFFIIVKWKQYFRKFCCSRERRYGRRTENLKPWTERALQVQRFVYECQMFIGSIWICTRYKVNCLCKYYILIGPGDKFHRYVFIVGILNERKSDHQAYFEWWELHSARFGNELMHLTCFGSRKSSFWKRAAKS